MGFCTSNPNLKQKTDPNPKTSTRNATRSYFGEYDPEATTWLNFVEGST